MGALVELDTAPAVSPASAAGARQRRGWFRRTYSPVEAEQGAAPRADEEESRKPRTAARPRWLRRLAAPREYALRQGWTKLSGAPSRLAAGLRWKRASSSGLPARGIGCASAVLDTVAFRVMYVAEAVVLGLALSCFFCCCGCQI